MAAYFVLKLLIDDQIDPRVSVAQGFLVFFHLLPVSAESMLEHLEHFV